MRDLNTADLEGEIWLQSLAKRYHQMVGLNDDWTIDSVELDMEVQTLSLALEFVDSKVKCPDCSTLCARRDKVPERNWKHLDAMQFQTLITTRVPRCSCETCGIKTIDIPWAGSMAASVDPTDGVD